MKQIITTSLIWLFSGAMVMASSSHRTKLPTYRTPIHSSHVGKTGQIRYSVADKSDYDLQEYDNLRVRSVNEILQSLDSIEPAVTGYNPLTGPYLYSGYQSPLPPELNYNIPQKFADINMRDSTDFHFKPIPEYTNALNVSKDLARMRYQYMLARPEVIEYASWLFPEPPQLPPEDYSFSAYLSRMKLPTLSVKGVGLTKRKIEHINWLHLVNGGVQFSQAYISRNWYQGGNDHLSLLANFYWNVQLNQAYHPTLLFQNTVSYKLGLNSTSQDEYHKYSISEDLFQWNMNFGVKARDKWYYSLTGQFKTQLLNSYGENSLVRNASFLSPGELNVGIGMTYSTVNKFNTFELKVAISPLSYNLKTCIDRHVDPTQFGIVTGHKTINEIGSSAEITMKWDLTSNINYRTRLFVFTDYKRYTQDWENTLSFSINRFLSTQIYAHLRYDTAATSINRWGRWMLKEILSFGFAYTFSTK